MIKFRKYTDLPYDLFSPLLVSKFASVILFNCDTFPRWSMDAFFHHSVCTLSNLFSKMVITNIRAVFSCKLINLDIAIIKNFTGSLFLIHFFRECNCKLAAHMFRNFIQKSLLLTCLRSLLNYNCLIVLNCNSVVIICCLVN